MYLADNKTIIIYIRWLLQGYFNGNLFVIYTVLLRIPSIPTTIKYQTRWTGHIWKITKQTYTATYSDCGYHSKVPGRTSSRYHQSCHHHHSFDWLVRGSTDGGTRSECTRFLSAIFCLFFVCVRFVCEFKW